MKSGGIVISNATPIAMEIVPTQLAFPACVIDEIVESAYRLHETEEALRESEARYRALTAFSSDWYWEQDTEQRFTRISEHVQDRTGIVPSTIIGKTRWETGVLYDTEERALLESAIDARQPFYDFQFTRVDAGGVLRHISISGEPIVDATGRYTGYRGIGKDITERKRAEAAFEESQRLACATLDALEDHVCVLDPCGSIFMVNNAWRRFVAANGGTGAGDFVGANYLEVCDHATGAAQSDGLAAGEGIRAVIAGRTTQFRYEYRCDTPTDVRWFAMKVTRFPGPAPASVVIAHENITERIQAAGRVERINTLYRALGETNDAIIRNRDRIALLSEVATITARAGHFMAVNIWMREAGSTLFQTVAAKGRSGDDLNDPIATIDLTGQAVDGSTAIALRRGRSDVRNELVRDANAPWRESSAPAGSRSGAAFPLRQDGEVVGALDMYSTEAGYFDPKLVDLLDRIASSLSLALDNLQRDTESRAADLALRDSEARFRSLTELSADWYWEQDEELRFTSRCNGTEIGASPRQEDDLGKTRWELSGLKAMDWREHRETLAARKSFRDFELTRTFPDGSTRDICISGAPYFDSAGRFSGYRGVGRDISDRKCAEKAIRDYARQQAVLAALGQFAFASTGLDELLTQAALAVGEGLAIGCCRILQFTPDQQSLVAKAGLGWHEAASERHAVEAGVGTQNAFVRDASQAVLVRDFATETRFKSDEFVTRHGIRSGVDVAIGGIGGHFGVVGAYSSDVDYFSSSSVDFLQNVANMLATVIDRRTAEEKVSYLAQFDPLTGLPNRNLLHDRLARTMAQAARQSSCVGVMFIDLDGFKDVNDTFGHSVGDELLFHVAQRLGECIREGDTIGRLGGDEFAIVLCDVAKVDDAKIVAQRVLEALARPFDLEGHDIRVTASLGIAVYPGDGDTPDLMLKNADAAMYRAKEQGRNGWQFYTEELNTRIIQRMALEQELRQAIERHEFRLHYQPEMDLASGRIVGVEALIRWQHPERGLLAPAEFIALAEETGLILPIGKWVVETACAQAAEWHRRGHRELFMAVNVSPMEIRRGNVVGHIRDALATSGLNPGCLEVELTEALGMDGAESFIRTLDALKAIGVTIAIDDFGTGYSTLAYLKRLPIDKVKVDRMFISDIVTEIDDAAIVHAIIAMAHHLKLKVTAEGVETAAQAGFLHHCHCDVVQGYLYGRPMDALELGELLSQTLGSPKWSPPGSENRSLLLVDDDPDVLRLLQLALRKDNYDIHTATSSEEALTLLASIRVAVIVSDHGMPGMCGMEFLRRVKTMYPDMLRIALSGYTDPDTVTAAINDGAVYKFLTKPCISAVFREEIRRAFQHHEQGALDQRVPAVPHSFGSPARVPSHVRIR